MRIVVGCVLLVSVAVAQFENRPAVLPLDTLATVGTQQISAKDFLERFELMPWPNRDKPSRIERTKLEFLHSLVAEKLLAMEAAAQNIGLDSSALEYQNGLERLFVRDEYYKREVLTNITITPEETNAGMKRFPTEIIAEVLALPSKKTGDALYKKFQRSKNKKGAVRSAIDSLSLPVDTVNITYGFREIPIEDAVFALGKDSVTLPVESQQYGWVMFHLLQRSTNMQNAQFSIPDRMHKVNTIIKDRKEDSLAAFVFATVTAQQRAEADPQLFFTLADSIIAMLYADSNSYHTQGGYQFNTFAVDQVSEKLKESLSKVFISITSGDMTLQDILRGLSSLYMTIPEPLDSGRIRIVLNSNIKVAIQNELLAREGYKSNIQQSGEVRHDLSVWMDSYKSKLLLRNIIDTLKNSADSLQRKRLNEFIQQKIDVYIGTLAKKYNVTVNEAALRATRTTTVNMVTWRNIGFGGKIFAVPQTHPQYEWQSEWKKQENINQ
ncbi:MAG: hypothetical protein WCW40_02840 [Bacteroidota bacterium]